MALRFRAATVDDVDAVVAHVNRGYRGESAKLGWTHEADILAGVRATRSMIEAIVASQPPLERIELAFRDDEAAAPDAIGVRDAAAPAAPLIACAYLRRDAGGANCYLGMLTVEPTAQNSGVGRAVLAHAEGLARGWGCSRMRMTVISTRSELIAYYERRGYVRTGIREPFPADAGVGVLLVPELWLDEFVKPL
jgi:GNAT superfamily N-acetyltransferase